MVDGDPMLVGVENGFVDLRTSAFAPYNADVVITKKMGVAYGASSRCPRWEQFMREILPNRRVRAFVAKAMGNCLTGNLNKGIMFLWGTGDNGKSVFLDVMFAIFGDYACRTSPQLLYKTKYIDEVPEHQKAELFGKRLAIGNEVAQDAKLNEAAVKEVTGESTTMGCRKWEHPFTFQQTAKIWIAGNDSPVVRGTDNAIWGRINKVEFPATFDKTQNTDIRDRLLEEAPGILNWLLNSARHAIADGNRPPKKVILAVDEYRREEDMLVEFVEGVFPRWRLRGGRRSIRCLPKMVQGSWCRAPSDSPKIGPRTTKPRVCIRPRQDRQQTRFSRQANESGGVSCRKRGFLESEVSKRQKSVRPRRLMGTRSLTL